MPTPQQTTVKWNPWPACLITFFSVAILSCAGFVAFCSLHPSELVTPDYYEQEMRYQAQMSRMDNARRLEIEPSVSYDPAARTINFSLAAAGLEGSRPSGTIHLYRPSAAELDQKHRLALDERGLQRIDARPLAPGLWKVRVSWTVDRKEYHLDRPVVIPGPAA
jgi:hypothetical protein